jgi:hypothetical protein
MASRKSEKKKILVVISLALVLAVSMYFQFVRGKSGGDEVDVSSADSLVQMKVPEVHLPPLAADERSAPTMNGLSYAIRDIFSPPKRQTKPRNPSTKESQKKPVGPLQLKGTIVGGKTPIAIVNDQFVREGDYIGAYRVVMIGQREVVLDSGDARIVLEILKRE